MRRAGQRSSAGIGTDIARRGWKRALRKSKAECGAYDWGIVGVGDQACDSRNNGSLGGIHHECTDQLVNDNKGAVEQSPRIERQKK
ncbi:hypothetical protein AYX15_07124 [Cryptococcus neoformans]|nr:hypothetical protein AYX15_07124 [Cryptococcus neoformans var. grubii]